MERQFGLWISSRGSSLFRQILQADCVTVMPDRVGASSLFLKYLISQESRSDPRSLPIAPHARHRAKLIARVTPCVGNSTPLPSSERRYAAHVGKIGSVLMMRCASSWSTSSAESPRIDRKTYVLCSPKHGAGRRTVEGSGENRGTNPG